MSMTDDARVIADTLHAQRLEAISRAEVVDLERQRLEMELARQPALHKERLRRDALICAASLWSHRDSTTATVLATAEDFLAWLQAVAS